MLLQFPPPPPGRWCLGIYPEPFEKRWTREGVRTAVEREQLPRRLRTEGCLWRVKGLLAVCFFCPRHNCLWGWKSFPWSWIVVSSVELALLATEVVWRRAGKSCAEAQCWYVTTSVSGLGFLFFFFKVVCLTFKLFKVLAPKLKGCFRWTRYLLIKFRCGICCLAWAFIYLFVFEIWLILQKKKIWKLHLIIELLNAFSVRSPGLDAPVRSSFSSMPSGSP